VVSEVTAPPASAPPPAPYAPATGAYDEAIAAGGAVRPHARAALGALAQAGIDTVADAVRAAVVAQGIAFHSVDGEQAFVVDPLPRVIDAAEWAHLEAGLIQRVQALDRFVDDVYGAGEAVRAGVVPERVVRTTDHFDPAAARLRPPGGVWIGVAGLDIVRDAAGTFRVLEDNVRTPSGMAYAMAARAALLAQLPLHKQDRPRPVDGAPAMLLDTLRAAAPAGAGPEPQAAVLSDGPANSAWWEHRRLAELMGVPVVTAEDVEVRGGRLWRRGDRTRPIDVVYRRTDDTSSTSWAAELLREPLEAGRVGIVNGFGTGVADDKLVHAHVEDLIRFFLGEEPLLPSVRSLDLLRPEQLAEALDRLDELVVKPRNGAGGVGVVICPHADPGTVQDLRAMLRAHPEDFIAQELVILSTHPTAVGGTLAPRHVDLRPYVFLGAERAGSVLPGGLTRVALEEGALVVNSSQRGGVKDTWVLA